MCLCVYVFARAIRFKHAEIPGKSDKVVMAMGSPLGITEW